MPTNLYGPGDNFDPNNAMVIPTLMNRIYNKEDPVTIWGDGSSIRDFAYADDVADGIILTMIHGTGNFDFLNLGSGLGYTIKELVETLSEIIKFNYEFSKKISLINANAEEIPVPSNSLDFVSIAFWIERLSKKILFSNLCSFSVMPNLLTSLSLEVQSVPKT